MSQYESFDEDIDQQAQLRYYCHRCMMAVSINEDTNMCMRCNDGFVEKVQDVDSDLEDLSDTDEYPNDSLFSHYELLAEEEANSPFFIPQDGPRSDSTHPEPRPRYGLSAHGGIMNQFSLPIFRREPQASQGQGIAAYPQTIPHPLYTRGSDQHLSENYEGMVRNLYDVFEAYGATPATNMFYQMFVPHDRHSRGATESLIGRLTRASFTEELRDKSSNCPICMESFNIEESVVSLACEHFFHPDCIIHWLRQRNTCPVCRTTLD